MVCLKKLESLHAVPKEGPTTNDSGLAICLDCVSCSPQYWQAAQKTTESAAAVRLVELAPFKLWSSQVGVTFVSIMAVEAFAGTFPVAWSSHTVNSDSHLTGNYVCSYIGVEKDTTVNLQGCSSQGSAAKAREPSAPDLRVYKNHLKVMYGSVGTDDVYEKVVGFVEERLVKPHGLKVDCVVVFGGPPCQTFSKFPKNEPTQQEKAEGKALVQGFLDLYDGIKSCCKDKGVASYIIMEYPESTRERGLRYRRFLEPYLAEQNPHGTLHVSTHSWCVYGRLVHPQKHTWVFSDLLGIPDMLCICTSNHAVTVRGMEDAYDRAGWPQGFVVRMLTPAAQDIRKRLMADGAAAAAAAALNDMHLNNVVGPAGD